MLFTYTLLLLALNHVGLGSLQDKQTDFGLRVFSQLSQSLTDKNMAMSPYGAVSIITMAQLGAAGKTLRALDSATGYSLLGECFGNKKKKGVRLLVRFPNICIKKKKYSAILK